MKDEKKNQKQTHSEPLYAHWKKVEIVGLTELPDSVEFFQCTNCGIIHRGRYLNGVHCERCNAYMVKRRDHHDR